MNAKQKATLVLGEGAILRNAVVRDTKVLIAGLGVVIEGCRFETCAVTRSDNQG